MRTLFLTLLPRIRPRHALKRLQRFWRSYQVLLIFLTGLMLLDFGIAALAPLWDHYAPDDYRARVEGCSAAQPELLVIGGSPVSEGIDPAHFLGLAWQEKPIERVYAMGLPGGTASEFWHACNRAVKTPPRVIIYGSSASDWNDRRHEPMGPHSIMTWRDLGVWIVHRPESAEWVTRHFLQSRLAQSWNLFQHRRGIRLWASHHLESYFPGSFPESSEDARDGATYSTLLREGNGYAPNPHYVHRSYEIEKRNEPTPTTIPHLRNYTLGAHLMYLEWLLEWARERNIQLIVVDMPVTEDLDVRMHPQEFARYRERLKELTSQRGLPLLQPTRQQLELDDRDFADVIHLNGQGAAKLSRWLRAKLEERP